VSDEIKVYVVDKGRKNLYMLYVDPFTGKQHTRTAGTNKQSEAERVAGKWQVELREGRYRKPSKLTWQEFREIYFRDKLALKSVATANATDTAFNQWNGGSTP
jgi:hypothetical protein